MQIDVHTISIKPACKAYDHMIRRFGDKPASRYQEASYDLQATEIFHYKPTWDPEQELYDASITKVVMEDWHDLKDPRQYYYSPYVLNRSREQDTVTSTFKFVESRGLIDELPDEIHDLVSKILLPLRHAAWGANLHNTFICGYGYSVTFTQPCIYQAMDNLGIAQYLTNIGLMLGGTDLLDEAKQSWIEDSAWQPLRRYVEDCLVVRDPFELFIAQNVALDGLLYPLIYKYIVDDYMAKKGGSTISMLTQFMPTWFDETSKWINAVVKVAVKESEHNHDVIKAWLEQWVSRATAAILPIVEMAIGDKTDEVIDEYVNLLESRLAKLGIKP